MTQFTSARSDGRSSLLWISRVTALVAVFALLFVSPLRYAPDYYLALSILGFVPLVCGPHLYRWFGAAFLFAALAFALQEHRGGLAYKAQVDRIRAESEAQQRQVAAQDR